MITMIERRYISLQSAALFLLVSFSMVCGQWHGQHQQDRIVINLLHELRNGWFVELGAADGIEISNTLALEESFGWHGLCIEPSSAYKGLLQSGRRCIKRSDVVSGRQGEVITFVDQAQAGSLAPPSLQATTTHANMETRSHAPSSTEGLYSGILKHMDAYSVQGNFVTKITRTLAELLEESHAPTHVDFLSLDTEGSEYDILSTFPFHLRTFGIILVEHNHIRKKRYQINRLLNSKGYVRIRCIETDDMYASLRIVSHYNIRVDPRECTSITIPFVCHSSLGSAHGQEECKNNGGDFMKYLDTHSPSPTERKSEAVNVFFDFLNQNRGDACQHCMSVW